MLLLKAEIMLAHDLGCRCKKNESIGENVSTLQVLLGSLHLYMNSYNKLKRREMH